MFSRAKTFVQNNWKKAVIGGVAFQAANYGFKYAMNRLVAYHEAQAEDLWKKMKKEEHFRSMDSNFVCTYKSLLPLLRASTASCLDFENLTEVLRNGIQNKIGVWEELKVIAFTRVLASIYGTALLSVLLRIQISVIGGCLFQESGKIREPEMKNVNGETIARISSIDSELQAKYLSLSSYLVETGMKDLCMNIYEKTKAAVGALPLKQQLTLCDLEQIFWNIIGALKRERGLSGNPTRGAWKYTIPPETLGSFDEFKREFERGRSSFEPPDIYKILMVETYDLLEADDVTGLVISFESLGLSHFLDRLGESLQTAGDDSNSVSYNELFSETTNPLAKIIPLMNSLSDSFLTESDPWIHLIVGSENIRTFGANIYESYSSTTLY